MSNDRFEGVGIDDGNHRRPQSSNKQDEEIDQRLSDREVPLSYEYERMSGAMHALLDGEVIDVRHIGDKQIEMWHKISSEAEILRSRTSPAGMQERIMAALPEHIYTPSDSASTGFKGVVGGIWRKLFTRTQSRPSDLA